MEVYGQGIRLPRHKRYFFRTGTTDLTSRVGPAGWRLVNGGEPSEFRRQRRTSWPRESFAARRIVCASFEDSPNLPINVKVRRFAGTLVEAGVVPAEKPGDALQMAVCAVHRIDYLVSWNYAHVVNPVAQRQLETVCRKHGLRAPLLVSPESIPKTSLGQAVRRRNA